MIYKTEINDEGQILINRIVINKDIFNDEKCEYTLRDREDFIDTLIDWISEATTDKEVMKYDLKYLMKLEDEYIFSSIITNKYIANCDMPEEFNKICKELLELNEKIHSENRRDNKY